MKYLLDSNIIIYLQTVQYRKTLEDLFEGNTIYTSHISMVEVLGFRKITPNEIAFFTNFFKHTALLEIDSRVIDNAIQLRQIKQLSLGDALIAATANVHALTLVTANTKDFKKFPELNLINPLEA